MLSVLLRYTDSDYSYVYYLITPLVFSNFSLNYLAFQPFNFERTWWRLFQKRVVRTKFDIYVFNFSQKRPINHVSKYLSSFEKICYPYFRHRPITIIQYSLLKPHPKNYNVHESVQSVPITTKVVSSNPTQARCSRYNIVIKFVIDLRQVSGFFPASIKLI